MKSRIRNDEIDRQTLRKKLENSIDIFETNQHPKDGLVNIATGKIITAPSVNVDESARIGEQKLQEFEANLPSGFYDPIKKIVKTMNVLQGVGAGDKKSLDPEVVYARALALRCIDADFDFEAILSHELAPFPTSMFEEEGILRTCRQKSKLMNCLKVEASERLSTIHPTGVFVDGCAAFWTVS